MAYKQNFGPSRKSGKAVSMCGISRITNEAYGAEIGGAAENAYSNYQGKATDASAYVQSSDIPTGGMTIDGSTGKSSGGTKTDIKKDGEGGVTKLGRLNNKVQKVKDGGGNKAKEARLKGRIDRTEKRQSERAVRVEKRNERKMDRTVKREKTKNKIHNFFSSDKYDIKESKPKSSGYKGWGMF
jgi:hypothetical protein